MLRIHLVIIAEKRNITVIDALFDYILYYSTSENPSERHTKNELKLYKLKYIEYEDIVFLDQLFQKTGPRFRMFVLANPSTIAALLDNMRDQHFYSDNSNK